MRGSPAEAGVERAENRHPCRQLALPAMIQLVLAGALQRRFQMTREQCDSARSERIADRVMPIRVDGLDRVIHRAHPGPGP